MQKMAMMDHIKAHSVQVCRVATALVVSMADPPTLLDVELIQAAALLHDITKTRSFKTGEKHASTGAALLDALGYPEVGRIVGQHVQLDTYFSPSSSDCFRRCASRFRSLSVFPYRWSI